MLKRADLAIIVESLEMLRFKSAIFIFPSISVCKNIIAKPSLKYVIKASWRVRIKSVFNSGIDVL